MTNKFIAIYIPIFICAVFAVKPGGSFAQAAPEPMQVTWTHLPAAKPGLTSKKYTPGANKGDGTDTYTVDIKQVETRIGYSEAPKASVKLIITTIAKHIIHSDYTEITYDIDLACSGHVVNTNPGKPLAINVNINGKDYLIQLGGEVPQNSIGAGGQFSKTETIKGSDIILHREPVLNLKKLKKEVKNVKDLQYHMKPHYPSGINSGDGTGSTKDPYPIYPYAVHDAAVSVHGVAFTVNFFGGAGNRMVRVNRPQYADDKPIKDRNRAESAIGALGVNLGLGYSFWKNHTIAAEAFVLKEGFRSTAAVNWADGKLTDGQGVYMDAEFRGGGVSYYYLANKFLFQTGLYYTRLHDAREVAEPVNTDAWIGKLAVGYNKRIIKCADLYFGPSLNYNFTPLSKQELMTRLFSFGITAGLRFAGMK
ncbi:hypothetical protein ACQKLP_11920 [Chitinophaga sp. NPDC101104]|uniref:hypothetical protein n=1 Tax=Chitinophaga sp. NPDC101104 TaxID=3390561 RepID=UPI003D042C0F